MKRALLMLTLLAACDRGPLEPAAPPAAVKDGTGWVGPCWLMKTYTLYLNDGTVAYLTLPDRMSPHDPCPTGELLNGYFRVHV